MSPGPTTSSDAVQAIVARGLNEMNQGRFASAEEIFEQNLREVSAPADTVELEAALARLMRFQGRLDEVRRLLRAIWRDARDPPSILRDLCLLDIEAVPVDGIRAVLEQGMRQSPQDDRVWLGLANMAIRTGRFDEAKRWLDACELRRPNDGAVWRARLDWARAIGNADWAWRALEHLPAQSASEVEVLSLRTWFAARSGDVERERAALTVLVEQDPANTAALGRLAELAIQAGQTERGAALRRQIACIEQVKDCYREQIVASPDPRTRAGALAQIAEQLGRSFEAQGWRAAGGIRGNGSGPAEHDSPVAQSAATLAGRVGDRGFHLVGKVHSVPAAEPPAAEPRFVDDAEAAGIRFQFESGETGFHQLPETASGGLGLLDYDGDGWLDVYIVQGGNFPPAQAPQPQRDRLFRNRGDGTFEDRTKTAGIARLGGGYGHGVTVGDFDNDGDPDLFLTRWRSYALYRNRGDGTFEDATEGAGLAGDRDWPTSAVFADFDADGDLDLYVCHYLAWDAANPRVCKSTTPGRGTVVRACRPRLFPALKDHVFRNDGGRLCGRNRSGRD